MAVLKIIKYPNAVLRKKAGAVRSVSAKERRLIHDMIETMYREDGVGLAAPQVGISTRIIVISPNACRGEEQAYINPQIVERSPEEEVGMEGCLSLPDISGEIRRAKKIKIRATNPDGTPVMEHMEGFKARVVQHEIDHLDGVLLIDRLDFNRKEILGRLERF